jgi:hypothetical protein
MASKDLFKSSPIANVALFNYPITYKNWKPDEQSKLPIGKKIEEQLLNSLEADNQYTIIAKGLQIQENGITLGELDFIIRDHTNDTVFHLELVHKFYIYDSSQGEDELSRWTGPNYRDKLSYKLEKLENHQFPLLYQARTRTYLNSLGLDPNSIEQRLCFKAELFVDETSVQPIANKQIQAFKTGNYYRFNALEGQLSQEAEFHVCEKRDWIQEEMSCTEWFNKTQCLATLTDFESEGKSKMVWFKLNKAVGRFLVLFN